LRGVWWLAEGLDVSYQQVQRYESWKNVLSIDKLQLIAELLDVSVDYFLREEARVVPGSLPRVCCRRR